MKILPIFGVVGLVACAGTEKPEVKTTPTINSISISPSEDITTSTELICIATASDEDNDSLIITYQWTDTQGNVLAETDAFVLSPDVVQPTAELTCTATVTDGENTITEQTSVTIGNTDPTVSNVSISPQEVLVDDLLECTFDSEDVDGEELTVSYSWTQNGTEVGTESSLQLDSESFSDDDVIVCTVTVEDGYEGTASDSADVVIGNTAPVIGSTTITPDPAHSYDTLTCTANDVIDLELDEVSISYEWSIDGEIQTETSQALEGPFAVGSTISCTTTPNDGKIDGETSDTDTTINNTPPVVDSVTITPAIAYADTLLNCEAAASDVDNEELSISYEWTQSNGTILGIEGELQLDSSIVSPDDILTCTATVTDPHGATDSQEGTVTVSNTAPIVGSAASITGDATTTSTLTCAATFSDLNDGTLTPSYSWTNQSGTELSTTDSYTIAASETETGDELTCTASVEDSDGATLSSSAAVTITNTDPVFDTTASISPNTSVVTDTALTCSAVASDADDGSATLSYSWMVGSSEVSTASTYTVSASDTDVGDSISCTVTATDDDSATATSTASVTVENTDPVLSAAIIDNAAPEVNEMIACSASVSDADGETLSATYEWTNGTTVLGSSASLTLTPSDAAVGDTITCTASVDDGYGGSDSTTATATIQNTDPTMSAVTVSPSSPSITDTLTCSATGTDLNDGTLTAVYSWTNNTTLATLGSASTLALDSSTSGPGDLIVCTVTYNDNNGGSVSDTGSVTITNTDPVFDTATSITPNTGVVTDTALTCAAVASDADDGSATLSYSWMVGSSEVSTASTYTVSASDTDVGDSISCTVIATDDDSATATSTASVTVENTVSTVSGTTISGGTYNTDTLTCSATASDVDESVTVAYTWSIDSVDVGTGASIDLGTTAALPADDVVCTASVNDSDGGSASETATLTLANRVPSTPVVSIAPTAPIEAVDDLVCNITTASTDADGQTVSYTYEWTKDSVATSDTTNTISASDVGASETWMCTVTPDDGMDFGSSASDSVTSALACGLTDCDSNLDLGNELSIDFVNITAGTFMMGSPDSELGRNSAKEEQHSVTLTNDFLVSTTEITQGMYNQLMGYQAYDGESTSDSNGSYGVGDEYPAYYVSWDMAADFSNKLTQQHNSINGTSLQECYSCSSSGTTSVSCSTSPAVTLIYSCTGYRLLTEAEWEYAARAGTTTAFWTSNGGGNLPSGYNSGTYILTDGFDLRTYGWYYRTYNSPYGSKEVATLIPNDNGLYDMSGNLYEWTHDTYTVSLGTDAMTDPVRETDSSHVFRGGDWDSQPENVRSARRGGTISQFRNRFLGFRSGRSNP